MKHATVVTTALAAMLASSTVWGSWKTRTYSDEMTDEKRVYASVVSKRADLLIYPAGASAAAGVLSVSLPEGEMIYHNPKSLVVRVDDYKPFTIPFESWQPTSVIFYVPIGMVQQMRTGRALKIRYHTAQHEYTTITFTLAGAKPALRTALPNFNLRFDVDDGKASKEIMDSPIFR